jgi:hypothetical protein
MDKSGKGSHPRPCPGLDCSGIGSSRRKNLKAAIFPLYRIRFGCSSR